MMQHNSESYTHVRAKVRSRRVRRGRSRRPREASLQNTSSALAESRATRGAAVPKNAVLSAAGDTKSACTYQINRYTLTGATRFKRWEENLLKVYSYRQMIIPVYNQKNVHKLRNTMYYKRIRGRGGFGICCSQRSGHYFFLHPVC
jgi:hypothetical protein